MFDLKRQLHSGDKVSIAAIILCFLVGLGLYNSLPDQIASHWNLDGLPNGFMAKEPFIIGFPLLMLVAFIVMSKMTKARELKYEMSTKRSFVTQTQTRGFVLMELLHREYAGFKASIVTFLGYIYLVILYSNSDFSPLHVSMSQLLFPGLAVLFYYLGTVLPRLKRNHLVGIRTPWTIHSDEAWHKTHLLGGKLFKALSILLMLATLTSSAISTALVVFPLLAVAAILIAYSYKVGGNEKKTRRSKKNENKTKVKRK